MNRVIHTAEAPPPFSDYCQAVETTDNVRWLHVSGQVGNNIDGQLDEGVEAQCEAAWSNVFAILEAGGMEKTDIVDVLAIVADYEGVPAYRTVRDRMLAGHKCCSTMLVCGLASPEWKVEIAVKAARSQ